MAEADLSVFMSDLMEEVNRFLFGDRSAANAGTAQGDDVRSAINRGIRQFLYPSPLRGETSSHRWSFLQTWSTLSVFSDQTGTHTSDPGTGTTLTDTAANFLVGVNSDGQELVGQVVTTTGTDGTTYTNTVASVTDGTNLEVTAAFDASIAVTNAYSIAVDGDYFLPDDFGGIRGHLTFQTRTGYPAIPVTSIDRVKRYRMDTRHTRLFRPRMAAVRPSTIVTETASEGIAESTRFELMLWPIPDTAYTLEYRYDHLLDRPRGADESGTHPRIPAGGLVHSETIMASCLAIAEEYGDTPATKYRELFAQRLAASVSLDRQMNQAEVVGYNDDTSDMSGRRVEPYLDVVTVGGIQYP
jgi:hypothetical protein